MERSYNPGDEYVFIYNGETHNVVVIYDNGDGIVEVSVDGGEPSQMAKLSFDEMNATYIGQKVLKEPEKKSDDKVNAKVEIKKAPKTKFSKLKDNVKEFFSSCGCGLILLIALGLLIYFGLTKHQSVKTKEKRSTARDSVDWVEEAKKIVIVSDNDSVFHYSTKCEYLGPHPEISIEYVARITGKWMCPYCAIKEVKYDINKEQYLQDLRDLDEY